MLKLRKLNQRGDTLVEVMIAVAVLSAILASSYTLSSYAARLGRSSKEHTQAVAYAQQQAEIIQSYAIRDWEGLVDILPVNNTDSHFNSDWEVRSGSLTYSPNEVAANYRVNAILTNRTCDGVCAVSNPIKQLTFHIEVDWISASSGPTEEDGSIVRDSTKLVVKVSPRGNE